MKVNTNVQSLAAQRRMGQLTSIEERESTRLSSGDRIYQAGFDPSGLAISSVMKAKIVGQAQAQRNINDGVSMVQVAEGTLAAMHDMGGRLMELAVAAANDTMGEQERLILAQEFNSTKEEYHRIRESAMFNGKPLMRGDGSAYEIQVGIHNEKSADRVSYDMKELLSNDFGINTMGVETKYRAQSSLSQVREMVAEVSRSRAVLGSVSNRMESALQNIQVSNENLQSSHSKIRDTDIAQSTAERAIAMINKDATTMALAHANQTPSRVQRLIEA